MPTNELAILAITFALAFLTESTVEYVLGTPFDRIEKLKPFKWLLMYVAGGVGVGLCLYYRLDIIALIARAATTDTPLAQVTVIGQVLSGVVVGRGANYLSDFLSKYLKPPKV